MVDIRRLWPKLPVCARRGLLQGSVGPLHLMGLATEVLEAGAAQPELLPLGVDLLVAAWCSGSMLDGAVAAQVAAVAERSPGVPEPVRRLARIAAASWRPPETTPLARLVARRDLGRLETLIARELARDPGNLFWVRHAVTIGLFDDRPSLVEQAVSALTQALPPLASAVAMELAAVRGDWEGVAALAPQVPGPVAAFGEALAVTRVGGVDAARPAWRRLLRQWPWLLQAVLVLFDLVDGVSIARCAPETAGVVAIYTLDKPEDLDRTLASLAASRLHGAQIWVLDNGCAAPAKAVMARWQEQLGPAMRTITLPVNIGAPAARNWIRAEFLKSGLPWLVYVDDDVQVPADWLEGLWAARMRVPEAGVWGCQVVDAARPWVLQSVDLHLTPASDEGQRFKVSDLHHQVLNWGAFAYLRPCASVTGCCHLLDARAVAAEGEFDIRFSPSQYDDLERDVRMLTAGRVAVYQGHVAIRHFKRTGLAAATSATQWANAAANLDKLQKKYSEETWKELMERETQVLEDDLWPKLARVRAWLAEEEG